MAFGEEHKTHRDCRKQRRRSRGRRNTKGGTQHGGAGQEGRPAETGDDTAGGSGSDHAIHSPGPPEVQRAFRTDSLRITRIAAVPGRSRPAAERPLCVFAQANRQRRRPIAAEGRTGKAYGRTASGSTGVPFHQRLASSSARIAKCSCGVPAGACRSCRRSRALARASPAPPSPSHRRSDPGARGSTHRRRSDRTDRRRCRLRCPRRVVQSCRPPRPRPAYSVAPAGPAPRADRVGRGARRTYRAAPPAHARDRHFEAACPKVLFGLADEGGLFGQLSRSLTAAALSTDVTGDDTAELLRGAGPGRPRKATISRAVAIMPVRKPPVAAKSIEPPDFSAAGGGWRSPVSR